MLPTKLANCKQWWNSPDFLLEEEIHWPNVSSYLHPMEDALREEKVNSCRSPHQPRKSTNVQITIYVSSSSEVEANLEAIIQCTKYSSLERLFGVTSFVQ